MVAATGGRCRSGRRGSGETLRVGATAAHRVPAARAPDGRSRAAEQGYDSWNLYRGDLTALVNTGIYTQAPGSNPLAAQECGLGDTFVEDLGVLEPGQVAFYLATGLNGTENSLGMGNGVERPNDNPCP